MNETFNIDEEVLQADIAEMAADATSVIALDPNRVAQLVAATKDENPEFPIIRVEGGLSRNNNNWTDEVIEHVAEQVNQNEPVGYLGHIKPEDHSFALPDPQTIWLKAVTKKEQGKTVLYVKGYNFPGEKIRTLLATGAVKSTSWSGKATGKVVGGVRQIERFALESIDWARKGTQGMSADVVALASEMNDERSDTEVDDLSKVTPDELRKANPSLFRLVEQECEAKANERVSEMEEKVKAADEAETIFTKLRKMFKIEESADMIEAMTKIHARLDNLSSKTLKEKIAAILGDKVKDPKALSTIQRLMPVTEMEGLEDDDLEKKVTEMIDNDEDMQAIITEMSSSPGPLSDRRRDGSGGSKVGGSGMVKEGHAVKL
jgi:hypothetical protein